MDTEFVIDRLVDLAQRNVRAGGRPFACIVVRDSAIIAEAANAVVDTFDPTAHAEVRAISAACRGLKTEHLHGCQVYALAYPCPMCLAALYYSSPDSFTYLAERAEYAPYYRDDGRYFTHADFYEEFARAPSDRRLPTEHIDDSRAIAVYREWRAVSGRTIPGGSDGHSVLSPERT